MNQEFRIPGGILLDRSRRLVFTFNGKTYEGYQGDTLASALLANGVHLVARSFKYHRPRGIMAAGVEEPNAIVQVGSGALTIPNLKATEVPLYDGLVANSVNVFPSVDFDFAAIAGAFTRLMPAGFYYKALFGSRWLWRHLYEPMIRRAGGWGVAPGEPDPDVYDRSYHHCDVLVVGGGASGLMAAFTAAKSGARVTLVDERDEFGGGLTQRSITLGSRSAVLWVRDIVADLERHPAVRLLRRTTVFGYYDGNCLAGIETRSAPGAREPVHEPCSRTTVGARHAGECDGRERTRPHSPSATHDTFGARIAFGGRGLLQRSFRLEQTFPGNLPRQRLWNFRAAQVILATGAHERPLVFTNNDRPGIMLAGAVQAYVSRWGVVPGRRAVVFTNNDRAYEIVPDLLAAGAEVAAIVDSRTGPEGSLVEAARARGVPVHAGNAIVDTQGRKRLSRVAVAKLSATASESEPLWLDCDLLAVSGGLSPVVHLHSQAQGKLVYDESTACFRPAESPPSRSSIGACNGTFTLREALAEGRAAGRSAARACGFDLRDEDEIPVTDEADAAPPLALWRVPPHRGAAGKAKQFVDLQNDTTVADIELAAREGFVSVEHMKRYTLTGFGTDQGKTSNINGLAVLAESVGAPIPRVGTTTFRPPYTPVTFAAMGGRDRGELFDPARLTSIHDRHVAAGARFEDVGQWKRPWFYPRDGEDMQAAVKRESLAVRERAGILDASTLGKIDIQGPDAAEFLSRVYTSDWLKLPVGKVRYGVMCREDGMVFDDGTTARLDEHRYLMTTTTGNAAAVLAHLEEYLQTEWPHLRVRLTSVTEQWATIGIAGPLSSRVLGKLAPAVDCSPSAFPFLAWRNAEIGGVQARIFRISFTGELQFEINVPWHYGGALWDAAMQAGEEFGITPYGTETMHVLRAEKGYIIIGQETDGAQTPHDLGLGWAVSGTRDFIGRRSMSRPDCVRRDRQQLVGLLPPKRNATIEEGTQLVVSGGVASIGFVTSSYSSATMESRICLALVERGRERHGEMIEAARESGPVPVQICDPVFYDREGARRDGG